VRLFAIGDLHLPSARGKDMDRFGWIGHPGPLAAAWDAGVGAEDLVLVLGDTSWATRAEEVSGDLAWIDARPGRKVLLKGNHDYWWPDSRRKLNGILGPYPSIVGALHHGSAHREDRYVIAGVRGWTAPEAPSLPGAESEMGIQATRSDLVTRDAARLERSIDAALVLARDPGTVRIACMHFPPLYSNRVPTVFSRAITRFAPAVCAYGHLHGPGIAAGFRGEEKGVRYILVSSDAAGFQPIDLLAAAAASPP
jgi:predicted phosphohydrolase